jgi:hypothetical protein
MNQNNPLPTVKNKKKIVKSSFIKLAEKVKSYLEDEQKYLENKSRNDEHRTITKFSTNY